MRKTMLGMVMAMVALLAGNARGGVEEAVAVCQYRDGKDAAFLLAFDDACVSHLKNAIPLLTKYETPGTFYLITEAGQFTWKKAEWAEVAKNPYVFLGNHTSTHKGINAPGELKPQIESANHTIHELTPDQPWPRLVSFAIPGGVPWKIAKPELATILAADNLVERPNFQGPPWFCGKIEEAEAYIDRTLAGKTMGHFDFHGIGGDWHVTPLDFFERVLKKLQANRDRFWLCPAIEWHQYVTEAKRAKLAVEAGEGEALKVALAVEGLDPKLYDYPLTLEVKRPWPAAKVTVKGVSQVVKANRGRLLVNLKPGEVALIEKGDAQ